MKKKTFFVLSLAFMLLGLNLSPIRAQEEFIIPASTYTLTSQAGTFTDIGTNANTVKLGTGLAKDMTLTNGFFVNALPDNPAANDNFVTHAADSSKRDTGFPLGFEFNLCGKKMTHFTICASGGIHFGQSAAIPQAQSAAWFTMSANYTNLVTLSVTAGGKTNAMTPVEGQAPAMYLIEGEDGAKVLTVQYDYNVNGDEWVYQLKAYEADGRIEMVVKDLATAHAGGTPYRLFLGLVENGNYSKTNDPFVILNLNTCTENVVSRGIHKIGFTQNSAAGWETFSAYHQDAIEGMFLSGTQKPAEGHTLAFRPGTCPDDPGLAADRYAFTLSSVSKTSMTGQIAYTSVTAAELSASGTVMAVLSTSETPDYTLTDGTWYRQGDKIGSATVLANAKPSYRTFGGNISGTLETLDLSANDLTAGTTYYIHIYAMSYQCLGAPTYSGLCRTFQFTSSIELPQKLNAGLPTTSSVPVTVQSAGEGFGVVLLKSPNTNPVSLSGKLNPGDKFGDVEVLTVINSATETSFDAPFEAGEGAYILAVSAQNLDGENPTYAADFLSIPVRAAYDHLPSFEFSRETASYPKPNEYPNLPFGWQRETELPANLRSHAFGIRGGDGDPICLSSSYDADTGWIDVVTPVFVSDKRDIQATFLVSYLKNAQQGDPLSYNAGETDEIRIEYAIGQGNWTALTQLKGTDDEFPAANAQGRYAISVNLRKITAGSAIRLRYSYKSPSPEATIHHRIHSLDIIEGKECITPKAVLAVDSLSTDHSVTLRWSDDNFPQAPNYLIAYRPAAETGNAWKYRRITTPAQHPANTPVETSIGELDAATLYTAQVAALCGTRDSSFFSQAITARTAFTLPYDESMAQTGTGASAQTPLDRGVKTYTGPLGGTLTESTDAGWSQTVMSDAHNRPVAVSTGDFTTNAWLMLPAVFIAETHLFTPKSIRFTLSSFDADKHKGVRPNFDDTKLHVLASRNGVFKRDDIIHTFEADGLALTDSVFSVDLTEREGRLQIAFLFECPSAATAQSDDTEPWYLELSQVRIDYDVDVCFPVTKLHRTLGINDIPMDWEASASAVSYGIFWGLNSEDGYTDTAYTTETHYTITGLKEQTRYKAAVIAYCSEDRSLYSEPATTSFYTLISCHTPLDFRAENPSETGVEFRSGSDQPDYMTRRIVYVWAEADGDAAERLTFIQNADTLRLTDTLEPKTAYLAATQAVCGTDTSAMSETIRFVTETTAVEPGAGLHRLFDVRTQDGVIYIRNLNGLLVKDVSVHNLNGTRIAGLRTNSRDDLSLPANARRALIFVRLSTETGTAVYKVYIP